MAGVVESAVVAAVTGRWWEGSAGVVGMVTAGVSVGVAVGVASAGVLPACMTTALGAASCRVDASRAGAMGSLVVGEARRMWLAW